MFNDVIRLNIDDALTNDETRSSSPVNYTANAANAANDDSDATGSDVASHWTDVAANAPQG